jgi:4-aminobutyrate aminotransferase/(S)-3-amino-2-methylpropionate transaminase
MTTAKGIAGGFPIAAVVGKAEIMDAPLPGGIGGTYAGSPVACAAALAVLDIIEEEGLVERAEYIGNVFNKRLRNLQHQFPHVIADVRNLGAMIAIELVKDGDIDAPDAELTKQIAAHAPEHGLIVLACGFRGNVIRFLPALTIEEEIMHEALDKFEGLFKSLAPETTSERIPEISPEITPHLEEVTERSSV